LLLDGPHSLRLVQVASRQQTVLLSDGSSSSQPETVVPSTATNTLLQPVPNSIWAADSRHFLFLTQQRQLWQNQSLKGGQGLYTVTINDHGQAQGRPVLVDSGKDSQAGWTYQDPNTSFLY
ncbi:MAG: hypothetical protein J2P37_35520, partial [Ktedonobacteraceae bacterium]|nr:hypothetical protein [Ktedonobacteraceae bacterium]